MFRQLVLWLGCAAVLGASQFEQAQSLYQRTLYDEAIRVLQSSAPQSPAAFALTGKAYLAKGDPKRAVEWFEQAVAAEPGSAEYHLWLGRAFGRRAEKALPFTAPGYASKARQNFEKAVALDPHHKEALNDLFEYYLQAPGFLGGGLDKASALQSRIAALDAAEGHYALARLAERRKEFNTAEQHFRMAAEVAPKQVGRLVDLAKFLAQRGKLGESNSTLRKAEAMAPQNPKLIFEKASIYIESKQNLEEARALLKRYLTLPLTPDDPPRSEAEKLLKAIGA